MLDCRSLQVYEYEAFKNVIIEYEVYEIIFLFGMYIAADELQRQNLCPSQAGTSQDCRL